MRSAISTDYSNTNTAVSLPPTQETPKMILRRILVSIVSSAALLLYSSLFISHCFAKTMQYVPRNIKYDDCSVCKAVAEQLFKEIKEHRPFDSNQPYYDPKSDIIAIAEDVCKLRKNDDWIWEIPIEKENLENAEGQVCDLGCRKTICNEVMENVTNHAIAEFAYKQWSDGEFESLNASLKAYLCENQTTACSTGLDEPKKNTEGQVCDLGCRETICNEVEHKHVEEPEKKKNVTFLQKVKGKVSKVYKKLRWW